MSSVKLDGYETHQQNIESGLGRRIRKEIQVEVAAPVHKAPVAVEGQRVGCRLLGRSRLLDRGFGLHNDSGPEQVVCLSPAVKAIARHELAGHFNLQMTRRITNSSASM